MLFKDYIVTLMKTTPPELYTGLILMLVIGVMVSLWTLDLKKGMQASAMIFFVVYGIYVISITVVYRSLLEESKINLTPLWSYTAIMNGKKELIEEILMNVVAFIPIGVALAVGIKKTGWWKIVLIGSMLSVSVELLQYHYRRGLCEFDDVFHNTLGCMIGYGVYALAKYGYERICKRSVRTLVEA